MISIFSSLFVVALLSGDFALSLPRTSRRITGENLNSKLRATEDVLIRSFDAQLDPSLAFVSGTILVGFGVVQNRINRSNQLIERIRNENIQMQRFRSLELDGDPEAGKLKRALEITVAELRREYISTVTFLEIPGLTLRFRVLEPDVAETISEMENILQPVDEGTTRPRMSKGDNGLGRVVVGIFLVSILFSLFSVLLTDPMTSSQSSLQNSPQPQQLQSLFNIP